MTRDRLRVLSVNASALGGGAERIALSLHEEYLARGIDSWLAVAAGAGAAGVVPISNNERRNPVARAAMAASMRADAHGAQRGSPSWLLTRGFRAVVEPARSLRVFLGHEDVDFPGTAALLREIVSDADVLHMHNLHGYYFDLRELPRLTAKTPTILTMHDAWLLTGHCAHPFDCPRWRIGCGSCPYPAVYPPMGRIDASARNWRVKREILARSRFRLATPSRWLMGMVEESGLLDGALEARVVPNGVDTRIFKPGDQREARAALGLDQDAEVLMFAANSLLDNPFKDYRTLLDALPLIAHAREGRLQLVALGDASAVPAVPGVDILALPFEPDPARVARYYQAADVYVHPARAENLPLAPMEAMACGTPVVASRVGGLPEIVDDGVTGTLVPVGDAEPLAAGVVALLGDEARRNAFSEAGLARVRELFTLERQADAYIAWYGELLDR